MANQVSTLSMNKEFKKTPIGEIPVDWEVLPLGKICEGKPKYGANVSALDFEEGLPRYVRITDITESGSLIKVDAKCISRQDAGPYMLKEGDVLFARSGATVGKTYLYRPADGECAFAGYLIRFKTYKSKLLPNYLFQFTHSEIYYQWVKSMLREGAQPNINGSEYSSLLIPISPLKEQKNILDILSAVDDAIQKTEAVIEKSKELMRATQSHLLSKGIGHKKYKKTKIGLLPDSWRIEPLGAIAKIRYGLGQPPELATPGVPMIRATNIKHWKIVPKDMIYVNREKLPLNREPFLKEGDIIVVRSGVNTGDVALITKEWEGAVAGYDLVVSLAEGHSPEFVFNYLTTDKVQNLFLHQSDRSAQPHLNAEQLSATPTPLPPHGEQLKIVNALSRINQTIEIEIKTAHAMALLKQGLMQVLLTGKVRV